jgi:hypothetical protein
MKNAALFLFLAIFGFIPAAFAQEESQFSPTAVGLYGDLQEQRCDPGWMSVVMTKNGIKTGDLRKLWRPITVDLAECKTIPPAEVLAATKSELREDLQMARSQKKSATKNDIRRSEIPPKPASKLTPPKQESSSARELELKTKLDAANAEIQRLKSVPDTSDAAIGTLRQKLEDAELTLEFERGQRLQIMLYVGGGTTVLYVLLFVWFWRREGRYGKRKRAELKALNQDLGAQLAAAKETMADLVSAMKDSICFDRQVAVEQGGEPYAFVCTGSERNRKGYVGLYICPLCGETLEVPEGGIIDFAGHIAECVTKRPFAVPEPLTETTV